MDIIEFQEIGFTKIKFVNLIDESEEIKWKVLEWHNQDFLLDKIGGDKYSIELHKQFLANLPNSKTKHYVVYYDGRAIGKYEFKLSATEIFDLANYLFYEADIMSGLGLLMRQAFFKYAFEVLKVKKISYQVFKSNIGSVSFSKKTGAVICSEDEKSYFYQMTDSRYLIYKEKIDALIRYMYQ